MEIQSSFWKVPDNFFKKYDFPELTILFKVLSDQKKLIDQLEIAYSTLERTYKSTANAMSSRSLTSIAIESSDECCQFNELIQSHNLLSRKFSNYAEKFGILRVNKLVPLKANYNNSAKNVTLEMNRLKQVLSQPFEELVEMRNSLDKYIKELQKLCSIQQPTQQDIQKIGKFIDGINKKLVKINNCYMAYRVKFDEYCKYREQLLIKIEKLVCDSKEEIKKLIDEGRNVDQDIAQQQKINNNHINTEISAPLFKNVNKEESSNNFVVTVERTINIHGTNEKLTPDESYVVIEALGDNWKIKNSKNEVFVVSSECFIPI